MIYQLDLLDLVNTLLEEHHKELHKIKTIMEVSYGISDLEAVLVHIDHIDEEILLINFNNFWYKSDKFILVNFLKII